MKQPAVPSLPLFFVGGAPSLGFATLGSDNVLLEAKLVVNPVADPGRKP